MVTRMSKKKRLDLLLFEKGLFPSREKARTSIMAGIVYVENQKVDKPGTMVNQDINLEIRGNPLPYVSRGGLKLEKALQEFGINLEGKTVIDIGASTGGFTDCALQNGAKKVYAVDVGYGQLAWSLRQDPRVVNLERTNARYLSSTDIEDEIDFACTDVSFISLEKILPVMFQLVNYKGEIIALIKPQFEAGKEKVGKKGVVREPKVHFEVINKVLSFAITLGFNLKGLSFSPITGPEGNIEYLFYANKEVSDQLGHPHQEWVANLDEQIWSIVQKAHSLLNK